jgi:phage tail-like protein
MPPATRNDPYPGFNFLVEIEGIGSASFHEVSGLEGSIDVVEYREGADRSLGVRKLPGLVRYPNVTLRRGVTDSRELWDWWQAVASGNYDRRAVAIVLRDRGGNDVRRWLLREAWPVRYQVSVLAATTSEVAIESLELAHEGLESE